MKGPVKRGGKGQNTSSPRSIAIEHDGRVYDVVVKRVATARRFTLRVRAARGDVVLTVPLHGSSQAARIFAARHAAWVAEKLSLLSGRIAFVPDAVIPVRGTPHRVTPQPGLRRRAWIEAARDGGEPRLCVTAPSGQVDAVVAAFLREEARLDLAAAVARHAAIVQRPVRGLTLRDTKTRWGSCTAQGTLNFSWRLILAPAAVLDYLAAHEVAHLVHLDHSPKFWTLARQLAPQIDEAEAWLKAHGSGLHHYGL